MTPSKWGLRYDGEYRSHILQTGAVGIWKIESLATGAEHAWIDVPQAFRVSDEETARQCAEELVAVLERYEATAALL